MAWGAYRMKIRDTGATETTWGTEIIWCSSEQYCGKLLVFKASGVKTAIQFQKLRHKSWFVHEGTFIVRWIDTETGVAKENVIKQGDVIAVPPLKPFQVEALIPGSVLMESGSAEYENDVCKLSPDEVMNLQPQEL